MSAERTGLRHPRWRWFVWIMLAILSAVGLRHYRVDNSMDGWIPELRASGPYASYLVIGWPTSSFTDGEVEGWVKSLPCVAFSVDRAAVRAASLLFDVTPEDFVIGPNGDYAGMFAFRRDDVRDADFFHAVRSIVADQGGTRAAEVAIAGPAAFHVALDDYSQRRLPWIMGSLTLAGLVLLRWLTGSWSAAVAGVAAVVLSQIILLGTIAWHRQPIDMSLSMVPPLMMALGYSYAAHRALQRKSSTTALFWCGLTTVAGIASFAWSDLPPIRAFAIYGAFGIGLVWLATASLVPPVPHQGLSGRFLRPLSLPCIRLASNRTFVIGLWACILTGGLLAMPRLTIGGDPLDFFPSDERIMRDFRTLDARLTGMLPFQIELPRDMDWHSIDWRSAGVRKAIDVTAFQPSGSGRYIWCLASNGALPRLIPAYEQWRQFSRHRDGSGDVRRTGVAAQLAESQRRMSRNAIGSVAAMAFIVALAIGLVSRNLWTTVAGACASLAPIAVLVLASAIADLAVDVPSLMIGAIAMGTAVDDAIHIAHARRRLRSPWRVFAACWRPCVGSTIITTACLCLFLVSPFAPTRQFGLLLAAATVAAAAANHTLLHGQRARVPCAGRPSGASPRESLAGTAR